jgi:CRISPR-associated endonuclease/helicase Cas3
MQISTHFFNRAKIKNNEKPYFGLKQAFKTAAANFDLIKENTISVITQYNNDDLIDSLYEAIDAENYDSIKLLLKKLQPYTISIRKTEEYESCVSKELDGKIFILNKEAYDEKIGLVKGELQLLLY